MRGNPWLICGGCLSLAAAAAHVACIFGGPDWYRFFGAGEPIAQTASTTAMPSVMSGGIHEPRSAAWAWR